VLVGPPRLVCKLSLLEAGLGLRLYWDVGWAEGWAEGCPGEWA